MQTQIKNEVWKLGNDMEIYAALTETLLVEVHTVAYCICNL